MSPNTSWSATGAAPYESLQVADVGDVRMNQYNLPEAVKDIKAAFSKLIENGCKTIAVGGDHTITYPILQAYKVSVKVLLMRSNMKLVNYEPLT